MLMCCKFDLSVVLLEGGAVSKKWGFVEVFRVYFGGPGLLYFLPHVHDKSSSLCYHDDVL